MSMDAPPRRTQTARIGLLTAVTLVLAALLGYMGYRGLRSYTAGRDTTEHFLKVAQTPTGLWITKTDSGELANMVVLIADPGGKGGTMAALPIGTSVDIGGEMVAYSKLFKERAADEFPKVVEDGIRLGFEFTQVSTPAEVAARLAPVLPVEVSLPADVVGPDGTVIDPQGPLTLNAGNVGKVWVDVGRGGANSVANMKAILDALAAKVGGTAAKPKPEGVALADFDALSTQVLAGPVRAASLPGVTRTQGVATLSIDVVQAAMLFAAAAPSRTPGFQSGNNVRIEAAPGSEALVQPLMAFSIFNSDNVLQLTYSLPEAPAETEIAYHTSDHKPGEVINGPIGPMKVVTLPVGKWYEGIDVVIRVGKNATPPSAPITEPPPGTNPASGDDNGDSGDGGGGDSGDTVPGS